MNKSNACYNGKKRLGTFGVVGVIRLLFLQEGSLYTRAQRVV
jgi:hypothetical protein